MMGNATASDVINIRQIRARYQLPADHPDPESLKRRLDETVMTALPEMLGTLTSALGGDDAVVLIQRLEMDFVLNAGCEKTRIARHWGQRILRELMIALHTEKGNGIARYPSRAAFVARFLADLVQGQAWGKWYYRQFDGLRMLPSSAALRTALCDSHNKGLDALIQLPDRDLVKVIQVLTPGDAQRILAHFAGQGDGAADADICMGVFVSVMGQRPDLAFQGENDMSTALRLTVEACRKVHGLSGTVRMDLALATVRLTRYVAEHSPAQGKVLIDLLTSGDKVALFRELGSDAEHWLPLLDASSDDIQSLAQRVMEQSHAMPRPSSVSSPSPQVTRFGSLFLLLPLLDDLPASEITRDWPAPEGSKPSKLLRLLLLMKCFGSSLAADAFFDPCLRDFLAIAPALTPTMLADWQEALSEKQREAGLGRFHDWQRSVGILGDENLLLTQVPIRGQLIALLLDCAGGWLVIDVPRPDTAKSLAQRIAAHVPHTAVRLLVDPGLMDSLEGERYSLEILPLDSERFAGLAQVSRGLAETLRCLDRLASEWTFLTLPKPFRGPPGAEATFNVMAHGLMRALARRLPGFARSSLPYLYDNFLDFGATVEAEEGCYVVRLQRPPLHVVLTMTGMARNHYRLSWLDGRAIELYQEG